MSHMNDEANKAMEELKETLDKWEPKENGYPESYTNFFKDRLREELDKETMVNIEILAELVSICYSFEQYAKVTKTDPVDPSKMTGQFSYRAWITAKELLREHGFKKWGDHKQATATMGDWQLDFNGRMQCCQNCNHGYAFRNDINNPKGEQTEVWTCTECKTDFTWPTSDHGG